ncbi:hypothetical protein M5689_009311 [Euphorbia peplus]|nr:hypothetical protein M5689_009311 [Euphorbia peplus]
MYFMTGNSNSVLIRVLSCSSSSTTTTLQIPKIPSNLGRKGFHQTPNSMSFSKNNHPFATPQTLSDWLTSRLPSESFASWGVKPGTKNVHNLWLELSQGETILADSTPPIRTVNVVTVRILGKDNQVLVESHQELSDGSFRNRCRPLAEKMKPDEDFEVAVFRAIKEELGCHGNVRILPGSYREKIEERNSVSYPGLPARYVLRSVDVTVDGLPEDEFCTDESEEYADCEDKRTADQALSCKKHFWKWVGSSA